MRKILRVLFVILMFLSIVAYIGALNINIKVYYTSAPEIQDEEHAPVWDDPEYWKNPWVL